MTTKLTTVLTDLNKQAFIKHILKQGDVYLVGGIVRDSFLEKENKDIDLLVTGIPTDVLISLLMPFGKVDAVGKSFGVLKFMPLTMNLTEPIDIAIPRTEKLILGGTSHTDFEVIASHDIPVEVDLKRRDFTINAMAVKMDGTLIDPFGGMKDLATKTIKMVDDVAFTDDPLRMLRAVQFASRLAFTIDQVTLSAITTKVHTIQHITPERVLIELEKMQQKGDAHYGITLLVMTGLYKQIFGVELDLDCLGETDLSIRGDFFYKLLTPFEDKAEAFLTLLKGDTDTAKCLRALQAGENGDYSTITMCRLVAFKMNKISEQSMVTEIMHAQLTKAIFELVTGKFPRTLKDLAITGEDLLAVGLVGKQVGDALEKALIAVMFEQVENKKEDLMKLITQ